MIYLYANENSTAFVELETVTDAKFFSRPHNAVIRIYVEAGNVIETHQHTGDFRECKCSAALLIAAGALVPLLVVAPENYSQIEYPT
jgi:hypothetical protein